MKNKLSTTILSSIVIIMLTFLSCKKQDQLLVEQSSVSQKSIDQLFFKWAQANNGRWLPYSVKIAKVNSTNKDGLALLESWALILKPVNIAKAYYRSLISAKTGMNDVALDRYLDSLYIRNYKAVNQSLKYQKNNRFFVSYL